MATSAISRLTASSAAVACESDVAAEPALSCVAGRWRWSSISACIVSSLLAVGCRTGELCGDVNFRCKPLAEAWTGGVAEGGRMWREGPAGGADEEGRTEEEEEDDDSEDGVAKACALLASSLLYSNFIFTRSFSRWLDRYDGGGAT